MDEAAEQAESEEPPTKRRKKDSDGGKRDDSSPNLSAMQPHLFHLLRHFVSKHTDIRDMLARSRKDGIQGYERVLEAIERRVATELIEYEATDGKSFQDELDKLGDAKDDDVPEGESSRGTVRSCKRPVWVAQPIIRPLPAEALAKGAIRLSKKELEAKAKGESAGKQGKKEEEVRKETKAETAEQEGTREEIQARDELVSG
jgi:tRNA-dihydrouridine synthase 1